jgi:hypothetical protein
MTQDILSISSIMNHNDQAETAEARKALTGRFGRAFAFPKTSGNQYRRSFSGLMF